MKRFCAKFILPIVFIVVVLQSVFAGSWISTDWKKRIPLTVNNSAGALTDYQLWIPTGIFSAGQWTDIKGGSGKANLDDLRFFNSASSLSLPYWIEDSTANPKGFWVKFSGTLPNGTTTIYVYYANPSATAANNGDNTFMLFDDFGDGIYTDKWTSVAGLWNESEGIITQSSSTVNSALYITNLNVTDNFVIESKTKTTQDNEFGVAGRLTDISNCWVFTAHSWGDTVDVYVKDNGVTYDQVANSLTIGNNTYYTIRGKISGQSGVSELFDTNWNSLSSVSTVSPHTTTGNKVALKCIGTAAWDWIRVRKYASSEPTVSAGTVETLDTELPNFLEFGHKNLAGSWLTEDAWNNDSTPDLRCKVQDTGSGLRVGQSELIASSGCVLLMHFNETETTPKDCSGYENHSSTWTATWTDTSKFGKAMNFDGLDDYVEIPDNTTLDLPKFTIELWVYPREIKTEYQPLITKESPSGMGKNYGLFIAPGSMKITFSFFASEWAGKAYDTNGSLLKDAWNHIATTYDGTNLNFYLNGKLDRSIAETLIPYLNSYPVRIGKSETYEGLNGIIDEVRILNRPASTEEIALSYNSGCLKYSTNHGNNWLIETSTTLVQTSGLNGSTAVEISTAISIPLRESSSPTDHPSKVKFIISDMQGNIAESPVYSLKIDTTPPVNLRISAITVNTSSITLQAEAEDKVTGMLSTSAYWFEEISGNPGANSSSDWQNNNFINNGLQLNTTYTYRVKARDFLLNESPYSLPVSTATLANPPTSSQITQISSDMITLIWSNNGNPDWTVYQVQYSTDSGFAVITGTSPYTTLSTYQLINLSPDTLYYLRVKARNHSGIDSAYSSIISTFTLANTPLLNALTDLTTNTVRINWLANNNPQDTEYFAEISSISANGPFAILSGWITSLTYKFSNLITNSTYYYQIKARNKSFIETNYTTTNKFLTLAGLPQIASSSHSSGEWTNNPSVIFTCAGSDHYRYRFNQIANHEPVNIDPYWGGSALTISLPSEGYWYFHVRGENAVDTLSGYNHFGPIKIDTTPPTNVQISAITVSTTQIALEGQANDALSGILNSSAFWFEELSANPGANSSSDWQNNNFINNGLQPNTTYTYRVKACDLVLNESSYSFPVSTATLANPPTSSQITQISSDMITLIWSNNGNPDWTVYTCEVSTIPDFSPDRIIGTTTTILSTYQLINLSPDTLYYLQVKARNHSGIDSPYTSIISTFTLASIPLLSALTDLTTNTVRINWLANNNPQDTEYLAEISSVSANGPFAILSSWITGLTYKFSNLITNSTYYYRIKARNKNFIETVYTTTNKFLTLAGLPQIASSSHSSGEWTNNPSVIFSGAGSDHYHYRFNQIANYEPINTDPYWDGSPLTISLLSEEYWYFHVRGENAVDTLSGYNHFGAIKIDTTPPEINSLNAKYASEDNLAIVSSSPTTHHTPQFFWTVPVSSSPIVGYSVIISTVDTEPDSLVDISTNCYDYTALSAGKYYFRVKAKDAASNWGNSLLFIYLYTPDTSSPGIIQSDFKGKDTNGNTTVVGVPPNPVLENIFNKTMDKNSLEQATVLKAICSRDGNEINLTIPGTVTYDLDSKKLTFVPVTSLPKGYTFELVISTLAKDTEGNPLSKAIVQKFSTIMDYTLENTVIGEDKKTKLQIPAKSMAKDYYVTIDTNPVNAALNQANEKMRKNFAYQALPGTMHEFKVLDETKNCINSQLKQLVKITLPLPESYSAKESIAVWYLDETRSLWVKIPTTLDTQDNTLTASVSHLSIYAVMNSASSGIGEVYAYPVPWRPNKGEPSRYGTLTEGITFTNLPDPATIRIYNLAGELVREIANITSPSYPWNGQTENGNPVTSGVYIYLVESAGKKKTGKLMIVR